MSLWLWNSSDHAVACGGVLYWLNGTSWERPVWGIVAFDPFWRREEFPSHFSAYGFRHIVAVFQEQPVPVSVPREAAAVAGV